MLGSGGGAPTPERWLPAFMVEDWMGTGVLLDAGEGAQLRLAQAGLSVNDIDFIAVTHAHGDHINGLAGLLQSMYMNDRSRPLTIYAPREAAEFVEDTLEAGGYRLGFEVRIRRIAGRGSELLASRGGDSLIISWFPVCHTVEAYGFRLEWRLRPRIDPEALRRAGVRGPLVSDLLRRGRVTVAGRTVRLEDVAGEPASAALVYTGDTRPCESVVEAARGARVLIHDSTFDSSLEEEAHERGHSTSLDAAQAASRAGVELLVLTHISARYREGAAPLLREARRVHARSLLAWDLARLAFRVG